MKTLLHVGCGPQTQQNLKGFGATEWREIRLDINPDVKPDVVGSLTDMSAVADGSVDAVYSAHNIEHLYAHEVPVAMQEFRRVLAPGGMVVLTCPDLQSVCAAVAKNQLLETLYVSPAGPIAALDVLYGFRAEIAAGNTYMAHKCGFTYDTLRKAFHDAGFEQCIGGCRPSAFDLWALAVKTKRGDADLRVLAGRYLP